MDGIGCLLSSIFFLFFSCLIFKKSNFFSSSFLLRVGAFHVARGFLWRLSLLDVGGVWDACAVSRGDGAGTLTYASGRTYVGEFKDDQMHGQGMSCVRES